MRVPTQWYLSIVENARHVSSRLYFATPHATPRRRKRNIMHARPGLVPPEPHRLVPPARGDALAVGAPVDTVHLVLVAGQVGGQLAGADVPDLKGRVLGRRDQEARVGREGALVDGRDVCPERVDELAIPVRSAA